MVRLGYSVLNRDDILVNIEGLKQLWKLRVEPAAQLCVWRALLNKLPTRENLTKSKVLLSCILCPFCKKHMKIAHFRRKGTWVGLGTVGLWDCIFFCYRLVIEDTNY